MKPIAQFRASGKWRASTWCVTGALLALLMLFPARAHASMFKGETLDTVKNHPLLKGVTIPRTGRIGPIGTLTTKTLVISGESGFTSTPAGRGAMLYAYDKATGKDAGHLFMPAPQTGSPMSYLLNGKQYLIVAISGAGFPAELIAYKVAD